MHPPPPSSIHLYPAYFSFLLALCNTLNNIWTKILLVIGQFPQIKDKKSKVVHFDWKLAHVVYWRCLFRIQTFRFLKFRPQNSFLENLGPKSQRCPFCLRIGTHAISRMLILIATLVFWISNFKLLFGQIWAKIVKVVLCKSFHAPYLENADSYCNICFLNFELKIHFWPNSSQTCPFCLKIGTLCILRMRILIPRLVFWILKPKFI